MDRLIVLVLEKTVSDAARDSCLWRSCAAGVHRLSSFWSSLPGLLWLGVVGGALQQHCECWADMLSLAHVLNFKSFCSWLCRSLIKKEHATKAEKPHFSKGLCGCVISCLQHLTTLFMLSRLKLVCLLTHCDLCLWPAFYAIVRERRFTSEA